MTALLSELWNLVKICDLCQHMARGCLKKVPCEDRNTSDVGPVDEADPVDSIVQKNLNEKYPMLKKFVQGDRFQKTPYDVKREEYMITCITSYFTSSHSKGMDPNSTGVKQAKSSLRSRLNKLGVILDRYPGLPELMDSKLFLNKELESGLKPGSKLKYCSDFISLDEAIIWNKRTFVGSERAMFFGDVGIDDIIESQNEVRKAKTRFFAEKNGVDICSRKIRATDFRRAKTTLGRQGVYNQGVTIKVFTSVQPSFL